MQELAAAISSANNLNLSATVSNGVLNLASTVANSTIAIGSGVGNTLAATITEGPALTGAGLTGTADGASTPAIPGLGSTATFTLGAGSVTTLNGSDVVTGSIAIGANGVNGGNKVTFTMGATADQVANDQSASQDYIAGNLLSSLTSAIGTTLGVSVGEAGNSMTLTSLTSNSIAITFSGSLNNYGIAPSQSSATLGTFASDGDAVSGTISLTAGNGAQTFSFANEKITDLLTSIDNSNLGVTASYSNPGGFGTLSLTSNTYGSAGNISATSGTTITDNNPVATLTYAGTSAYSVGISNSTATSTALRRPATSRIRLPTLQTPTS